MLYHVLKFTDLFWPLLQPSSGCCTWILVKYNILILIYDKAYFISVHLLVYYISVNISYCRDMEHTKWHCTFRFHEIFGLGTKIIYYMYFRLYVVELTTWPHLELKLWIRGASLALSLYTFTVLCLKTETAAFQSIITSLFHIAEIRLQSTGIQVHVVRHCGECKECSYYYSSTNCGKEE